MFNSKRITQLEKRVASLEEAVAKKMLESIVDSMGHLALTFIKNKKKTEKKKRTYKKSGKYAKVTK